MKHIKTFEDQQYDNWIAKQAEKAKSYKFQRGDKVKFIEDNGLIYEIVLAQEYTPNKPKYTILDIKNKEIIFAFEEDLRHLTELEKDTLKYNL